MHLLGLPNQISVQSNKFYTVTPANIRQRRANVLTRLLANSDRASQLDTS